MTANENNSETAPEAQASAEADVEAAADVGSGNERDDAATEERDTLAADLLAAPIATDDAPEKRWSYPLWGMALVSLFVLYHSTILLVHNLPTTGLSVSLHKWFNASHDVTVLGHPMKLSFDMRTYMQTTGNTQSWAMFAPNPHRSNIFMKVRVKDADGEVWDMAHDIYGRRSYPYMFYDRMGKINRRIIDQKGYRRHYAAWVCREWERTHEGEAAEEIQFVKMWTRIPPPEKLIAEAKGNPFKMGYDPMKLKLYEREEPAIRCRTTRQGQLPNELRERYGFEPVDEDVFRGIHIRTWHDKQETAERANDIKAGQVKKLTDSLGGVPKVRRGDAK